MRSSHIAYWQPDGYAEKYLLPNVAPIPCTTPKMKDDNLEDTSRTGSDAAGGNTEQKSLLAADKHNQIIDDTWSFQNHAADTMRKSLSLQAAQLSYLDSTWAESLLSTSCAAGIADGTLVSQQALDGLLLNDKTARITEAAMETVKPCPDAEVAAMKALLDEASKLAIDTTLHDKQAGIEPDIIIDKHGVPHLNPFRRRLGPDETVFVALEADDNWREISAAQAADQLQKACVRDLISYFEMQNPGASIPDEWLSVLSRQPDLPPPHSGAGGGFRGGEGGGYAGGCGGHPGTISDHIPHRVARGVDVGHATKMENALAPRLKDSLDLHKFVDRVVAAVSGNEGNFQSINRNDSGYGISVGIRQWNQKVGELPGLLKAWHDKDPEKFQQIFGENANNLLKENWVRQANFQAQPGLMDSMKNALADHEFQDVQVQLARDFVVRGIQLGMKYGLKSELALAHVVDMANQKGFGGAESVLRRAGQLGGNEKDIVHRLEDAAHRAGGHKRLQALEQKFDANKQVGG